jgi:hypothetical protein
MQLNLNLMNARQALADSSALLKREENNQNNAKNASELSEKLTPIIQEITQHVQYYQAVGEQSPKAKVHVYNPLISHLKKIEKLINSKRTLLDNFHSLKGEVKLKELIKKIDPDFTQAINQEKNIWKGEQLIFVDEAEISLRRKLCPKTNNEMNEIYYDVKRGRSFIELKKALKNWQESYFIVPASLLKEGYLRVRGETVIQNILLEDCEPSINFKSIRQDVENFRGSFKEFLTPEQNKGFEHLIKILDVSANLSRHRDFEGFLNKLPDDYRNKFESGEKRATNRTLRLADAVFSIQRQLSALEEKDSILIPGGCTYGNSGENILFEIKHERAGLYTFTVINNGAGIPIKPCLANTLRSEDPEWSKSDYVIKCLPLEQIIKMDFLIELIKPRTSAKKDKSVRYTLDPVISTLLEDQPEIFEKGFKHQTQQYHSSFHDSILSWMESKMDPILFGCLDLFMTKRGLKSLNACGVFIQEHQFEGGKIDDTYIQKHELIPFLTSLGSNLYHQKKEALHRNLETIKSHIKQKSHEENEQLKIQLKTVVESMNELRIESDFKTHTDVLLSEITSLEQGIYELCKSGKLKDKSELDALKENQKKTRQYLAHLKEKLRNLKEPTSDELKQIQEKIEEHSMKVKILSDKIDQNNSLPKELIMEDTLFEMIQRIPMNQI